MSKNYFRCRKSRFFFGRAVKNRRDRRGVESASTRATSSANEPGVILNTKNGFAPWRLEEHEWPTQKGVELMHTTKTLLTQSVKWYLDEMQKLVFIFVSRLWYLWVNWKYFETLRVNERNGLKMLWSIFFVQGLQTATRQTSNIGLFRISNDTTLHSWNAFFNCYWNS